MKTRPKNTSRDETVEDIGTARLVASARKEISEGAVLIPKQLVDYVINEKIAEDRK
jgi:hypothetical protein